MPCLESSRFHFLNTMPGGTASIPSRSSRPPGRPVLSLLRPGKRPSGGEVEQILRHVIGRIRRNWPAVEIMVGGDSQETDFSLGPAPAVADAASATIMR